MTPRTLPRVLALASLAAFLSCAQVVGLSSLHDGICTPGVTRECPYTGPEGTKGVGICKAAVQTCSGDGLTWSDCTGEVTPVTTVTNCLTSADDTCTGKPAPGCCTPGDTMSCYDSPTGKAGVGICKSGTQACGSDGKTYGACMGAVTPQQETCSNPADENCDGYDCVEWAELFGDSADQSLAAVTVDAAGNIIVAGQLHGSIALGANPLTESGSGDALVLKLDATGKALWGQSIGDTTQQSATAIAVDSAGDVFVGGLSAGAFTIAGTAIPAGLFLAKLAGSDGHVLWGKGLGGACATLTDAQVSSIAVTAQNDIVVAGTYCSSIDFGDGPKPAVWPGGSQDAFVTLLRGGDGSGKKADGYWGTYFGDDKEQQATGVAVAKNGHILVTGSFQGGIQIGPVNGATSAGGYDVFVAEYAPDGTAWDLHRYGDTSDQQAGGIRVASNGDYVLAGVFKGTVDFGGGAITDTTSANALFVAKFADVNDLSWQHQWSKGIGTMTAGAALSSLAVDTSGAIAIAGFFVGALDFGSNVSLTAGTDYDGFFAKLDSMGNGVWARSFLGLDMMANYTGAVTTLAPSGETVLAGTSSLTLDLGTGTLKPTGGSDAVVAKFGL